MLEAEPGCEVAQLPDDTSVGGPHALTGLAAEDQHERSLASRIHRSDLVSGSSHSVPFLFLTAACA